jgi:hypothetical protein
MIIGNCAKAYLSAIPSGWDEDVQQLQLDLPIYASSRAFHLEVSSSAIKPSKELTVIAVR